MKLTNLAENYNVSELIDSYLAANFKKTINILNENNFSIDDKITISVEITASEHALSGTYKVLLGAYTNDIAVSQFVTVIVV